MDEADEQALSSIGGLGIPDEGGWLRRLRRMEVIRNDWRNDCLARSTVENQDTHKRRIRMLDGLKEDGRKDNWKPVKLETEGLKTKEKDQNRQNRSSFSSFVSRMNICSIGLSLAVPPFSQSQNYIYWIKTANSNLFDRL